jgi:hypothetical protein
LGLLRRKKGRHALGAAVTSIPSAPLPVLAAVPAPATRVPVDPVAEPDTMTSIAQLIATGEAWATRPPRTAAVAAPPPVAPRNSQVPAAPVMPPPVVAALATPAEASALSSLEAAVAELLLPSSAEAPAGPPAQALAAPRVQLGFRDGSSTTLEPGSSQARALEALADSLARRD